jgi:NAD(P)H-nitrite reductase large subunit
MAKYNYLIIGGGIAGTTAAEILRKNDPVSSIAIVSDEAHPLYSRVLLSKIGVLNGEKSLESVFLKNQAWYDTNKITFISGAAATALNPVLKKVSIPGGKDAEYDKLLLAFGVHAKKWTVPGAEKKGVLHLRGLDDMKALIEAFRTKKHAVLIGSGFVSFEIAEVLRSLNINTTLVMRGKYFADHVLSEPEGLMIEKNLTDHGVIIKKEMEVSEVLGDSEVNGVMLKDGTKLECDMVLSMIGIMYPTQWLKSSGIKLNTGVITNEFLETSIPGVFAAGDVAEFFDKILKEPFMYGSWMNARTQGEVAALNMFGKKTELKVVSFQTSNGFGNTIGITGDTRELPGRKVITRSSPIDNSYTRLLLKDGVIVGATLINRVQELATISRLIKEQVNVSAKEGEMNNSKFDLKTLVPTF